VVNLRNKEGFAEVTTSLTDLCFVLVTSEQCEFCVSFKLLINPVTHYRRHCLA